MSRRKKRNKDVAEDDGRPRPDGDADQRPIPVSQSRLATTSGVARSTVSRAKRGPLAAAMLQGGEIDAAHPDAREWLEARGVDPDVFGAPTRPTDELEREVAEGGDLDADEVETAIQQLTDRYGHDERVYRWARARKELAMSRRAEKQLERVQSKLASWELVNRLFEHVDRLHRMLLRDAPPRMARHVPAERRDEATRELQGLVGQYLKAAKSHMRKTLAADDPEAPLEEAAGSPAVGGPDRDEVMEAQQRARELAERVAGAVAPELVDTVGKAIGHAAVGKPWHENVWNDAMELVSSVRDEAERQARTVLAARLEREARGPGSENDNGGND